MSAGLRRFAGIANLALVCLLTPEIGAAGEATASDRDWPTADAIECGFDAVALTRALERAVQSPDNIHAILVERHGRIIAEVYRQGPDRPINVLYGLGNPFARDVAFGPAVRHDLRSISKSVVSLLVGIAQAQGRLRPLDTPLRDFYPEIAALRSPPASALTLEHLLDMSSGLVWDEGSLPNDETRLYWKSDVPRFVLARPTAAAPGTVFNYNSGGFALAADLLTRETGSTLPDLVRTTLFEPLGISDWEWALDTRDRPLAFTGLRMRPRDLVKIGRLMLNHGVWNGRPIVPAAWVSASLRPRCATGFRPGVPGQGPLYYGHGWWHGTTAVSDRTVAWSAGFGNGGQRLFLCPDLDLSVVVLAGAYGTTRVNETVLRLWSDVVAAVR